MLIKKVWTVYFFVVRQTEQARARQQWLCSGYIREQAGEHTNKGSELNEIWEQAEVQNHKARGKVQAKVQKRPAYGTVDKLVVSKGPWADSVLGGWWVSEQQVCRGAEAQMAEHTGVLQWPLDAMSMPQHSVSSPSMLYHCSFIASRQTYLILNTRLLPFPGCTIWHCRVFSPPLVGFIASWLCIPPNPHFYFAKVFLDVNIIFLWSTLGMILILFLIPTG